MKNMKHIFTLLLFLFTMVLHAQIVITEISYNPPESGVDSLEYIEIYNASENEMDLDGWYFSSGVEYTFSNTSLMPGDYFVVAVNINAMQSVLSTSADLFIGALTNGGELIELADDGGNIIDVVDYSDSGDWPSSANGTDGGGSSIELCDVDSDNNVGSNWRAADNQLGVFAGDNEYLGTPGFANTVVCNEVTFMPMSIEDASMVDAEGVLINAGSNAEIQGIVHGVNINPEGLQFTLINENNEGIGVYAGSDNLGYEVVEGDLITIQGGLGQFNGLAQINPVSISLDASGMDTVAPNEVSALGEETESSLVTFTGASIVDVDQWGSGTSGFNVEVSNGTETITLRIDNDVDLFTMSAPDGLFDVTGIGGQFDQNSPYLEGYQLLPRYSADIKPLSNIEPIIDNSVIAIMPNPVRNMLVWTTLIEENNVDHVQIYSWTGERILVTSSRSIDVSNLSPGTYILKASTSNGVSIQKFIKL